MKMKKNVVNISILSLTLLFVINCREPFEIESLDYVNALVVESTITNELKHQEVKLTRTYRLDESAPSIENNATVWIEDSNDITYSFSQSPDGTYLSDIEFQAVENVTYVLNISTQDGRQYHSESVVLTPVSEISNLYAEKVINNNGSEGIEVIIDSDNLTDDARYFRYEYEETYKIVAPNYFPLDLNIINLSQNANGLEYDRVLPVREQEERICYTTKNSVGIIQTTTTDLENNQVFRFPVRVIDIDNSILRERYSILVKQYVQSIEAYTFYKTIDELGGFGSILSQSQPGYVLGNIVSENDSSEKIIGYFDVSTVSSDRIYFNYSDFNLPTPPYFYECNVVTLDYNDNSPHDGDPNERNLLFQFITVNNFKLLNGSDFSTIYDIVNPECGDCTSISSNIRPDFWED